MIEHHSEFEIFGSKVTFIEQLNCTFLDIFQALQSYHQSHKACADEHKMEKGEHNNSESSLLLSVQVLIICVLREIWKIQLNELSKGFINRPLPPP